MRGKKASLAERLAEKYEVAEGDCWTWTGKLRKDGYGVIAEGNMSRRELRAHRVSYELRNGPIPEGLTIDHLCRNRACVNPDHLEAIERSANVLRGIGPAAVNRRKTICKRGHPLTPKNVYVTKSGYRNCRTCAKLYQRKLRELRAAGLPTQNVSAQF